MCVQRYIVARSRNHCCYGNSTVPSPFIVVSSRIAVKDVYMFSVAKKIQQCVSFVLFSNRKTFRIV